MLGNLSSVGTIIASRRRLSAALLCSAGAVAIALTTIVQTDVDGDKAAQSGAALGDRRAHPSGPAISALPKAAAPARLGRIDLMPSAFLPPRMPKPRPAADFSVAASASLAARFRAVGYDLPSVLAGRRSVPRLLLGTLPADWSDATVGRARKTLFVQTVLPLVLEVNRSILSDRRRLRELAGGGAVTAADKRWIRALAQTYRSGRADPDALLWRVDVVPPSVALAQAALESGWGASRFAAEGNALFGQWTWAPEAGLAPAGRDAEDGRRIAVKTFPQLLNSVEAYMLNLNRQEAYADFRRRRSDLRALGMAVSGTHLMPGLTRYSVERELYVEKVSALIRQNRLHAFDRLPFAH